MSCLNSKCKSDLVAEADFIACLGCALKCHVECAKLKPQENKKQWYCPKCTKGNKVKTPKEDIPFVFPPAFTAAIAELKCELLESFRVVSEDLRSFKDGIAKKVIAIEAGVVALQQRCDEKDERIELLVQQVNALDQYGRRNNIEIDNITEVVDENIEAIVIKVAAKLSVVLSANDIEAAHRLPSRNTGRPAKIIVRFVNRKKREEIISKKKLAATIKSQDIVEVGQFRIYINENLSPYFRELLWTVKTRAKASGFKFVWWSRGKILVRKDETSRNVIRINCFKDIDLLDSDKQGNSVSVEGT